MSRALCLLALLCLAGCDAYREMREMRREKLVHICYRGPEATEIVAQIPRRGGGVVEIRSKELQRCTTP